MATRSVGRKKGFDETVAIRKAVDVFWKHGYSATSLDDLLLGMGVARSSFYATFGSKHAVMIAALELYTGELYERMQAAVESAAGARQALKAVIEIASCSLRPAQGCMFINMTTELAPADAQVRKLSRAHLSKVDKLVQSLLEQCGVGADRIDATSAALLSMASGALSLRKAGESPARIQGMLAMVGSLIDTK